MYPAAKPKVWNVLKTADGAALVACGSKRLFVGTSSEQATKLANLLNSKEREIARLTNQYNELRDRT